MTSASFLRLPMEPSILRGQHGKCFFELRGELALALIAHGPGDLSHAVVALQQQSGGPLHAVLADMGLPYTSLNSSFMVEGFMRNCRDSCSMVMRLSRCSVRNRWTCRMTSSCSAGQLPQ